MPADLLPEVRRLMSENKGDRVIAETLDITRHQARNLMRDVERADGPNVPKMPAVISHDPDAWALLINGAYRRSYDSTIEAGKLLIAAKDQLGPRGTWLEMLETKLDFSPDTAQRLMSIARDERLTNTAHVRFLPRSYSTLAELTKLSDEEFARGIEEKIISPEMERKDVYRLRPRPESSDGGGESGPAPEGSATISASGLRERHPRDLEAAGSQSEAETGRSPEMARAMEQASDRESQDSDLIAGPSAEWGRAGVAPGPSETQPDAPAAHMAGRVHPAGDADYSPTPPWATRALIERVFRHAGWEGRCKWQSAWEPACGEGHMAEVMREYFRDVFATDIEDRNGYPDGRNDFLANDGRGPGTYDWIITNPPFGDNVLPFMKRALDLAGTGVAMFLQLRYLEGVERYEGVFRDRPPTIVAPFVERVPLVMGRFDPEASTTTAFMWLVWHKGVNPRAPFWIPNGCRVALTMPDDAERFTQSPVARRDPKATADPASARMEDAENSLSIVQSNSDHTIEAAE